LTADPSGARGRDAPVLRGVKLKGWCRKEVSTGTCVGRSSVVFTGRAGKMTQKTAQNLGDALQMMQQQSASERAQDARETPAGAGVLVAPGVRFSERLWAKLGDKKHEADRQGRRERMTQATALPAPRFDAEFRRDSIWKQRCPKL